MIDIQSKKVKIKNFILRNKYILVFLFLVLIIGMILPQGAEAGVFDWLGAKASDVAKGILAGMLSLVNLLLNAILTVFFWLISVTLLALVQIAAYQDFISLPIVGSTWILFRDLLNMVFVISILMIAIKTLLGFEKSWQSSLMKLIFAVIIVNFSKMIVGILIDISQIIMLTFINGIRNVAGGNVIKGLHLNVFLNNTGFTTDWESATTSFTILLAGILSSVLIWYIIALITLFLLMRVVKLWLLIILSPILAIEYTPIQPYLKDLTGQWNSQLREQLTAGPIMAFTLWFALSVIGDDKSNSILSNSSTLPDSTTNTLAEKTNDIYRVLIGTALLYASYNVAKKVAPQASSILDKGIKYVNPKERLKQGLLLAWQGVKKSDRFMGHVTGGLLGRQVSVGMTVDKVKEWAKDKQNKYLTGTVMRLDSTYDKKRKARIEKNIKNTEIFKKMELEEKELKTKSENLETKTKRANIINKFVNTAKQKDQLEESTFWNLDKAKKVELLESFGVSLTKRERTALLETDPNIKLDEEEKKNLLNKANKNASYYTKVQEAVENKNVNSVATVFKEMQKAGIMDEGFVQGLKLNELEADDMQRLSEKPEEYIEGLEHDKDETKHKLDVVSANIKDMFLKAAVEYAQSPSHRLAQKNIEEDKAKLWKYLEEKYREVDTPDEIAHLLRQPELLKREEVLFLLEKSKDDLTEVFRYLKLPKQMDAVKYLLVKSDMASRREFEKEVGVEGPALDLLVQSNALTDENKNKLTELLNNTLDQVEIESIQKIAKQNEKDNAAFLYATKKGETGIDKLVDSTEQYKMVNASYENGDISNKAMSQFRIAQNDKGDFYLTKAGYDYLKSYPKEVEKAAISGELSMNYWKAIQNNEKQLSAKFKEMYESGRITEKYFKSLQAALDAIGQGKPKHLLEMKKEYDESMFKKT